MKIVLLACCIFLLTVNAFSQQFTQYNTGTLYDSFENPSQRSFIPDSSRQIAFNFLIPNISTNFVVTGNAQDALTSRIFSGYYNAASLKVGESKLNFIHANVNAYLIMLKLFTSLNGNQEIGFAVSTKGESRGMLTDESVALFGGPANFKNNTYNNVFNDNYFYQLYHQFSFTYREQVTRQFAFGVKLSALSGVDYREANITQSSITFDGPNDAATLSLYGVGRSSGVIVSGLRLSNPGSAISIGTTYINRDGYRFQYNLKDLGFIYWGNEAERASFGNAGALITGLNTDKREGNIFDAVQGLTTGNQIKTSFYSKTNALAEVSVNKNYLLDYEGKFRFSPTLIASKEVFYSGFTGALIAPVQYQNLMGTVSASYNSMGLFNLGGQAMIKSPNAEFYIGCESLIQTGRAVITAIRGNELTQPQIIRRQGSFSGASFFIGASFKFGSVIEHPMNASWIPTGEKGFIGRLYEKIFKKDKNY